MHGFYYKVYPRFSKKNNKNVLIGLYISGRNATTYFHLLADQRQEIEKEFGESLEWNEFDGKIYNRISLSNNYGDLLDETNWYNQYGRIAAKLERFKEIFYPRIKKLNSPD